MSGGRLGAVLAGGNSRRMGRDKAALQVGERSLVEIAAGRLAPLVDEVVVVGGEAPAGWAGPPWVPDDRPGLGPLGGLVTALRRAVGGDLLVLACDLPRVGTALLGELAACGPDFGRSEPEARLAGTSATRQAGVDAEETTGCQQPLCGLYSARCLGVFDACLEAGDLAVHAALESIAVTLVDASKHGDGAEVLLNVNRPADYRRLLELEAVDAD